MLYENKTDYIKARKNNARLYPIYKMCSWDLLFYYAISFIFLVQTKGFTPAEVMLTDAIYTLFKLFLNIPSTVIIEKIGKKKSLILANSLLSLYVILIILINSILGLIFAYLIMSFCFSIKNIAESNLLYDSVTQKNGKGMFSKLEELGARNYYFLDGITSILTGFLYVINGYIPMLVCFLFTLVSIFKVDSIFSMSSLLSKILPLYNAFNKVFLFCINATFITLNNVFSFFNLTLWSSSNLNLITA